jgi:hypothetical protein
MAGLLVLIAFALSAVAMTIGVPSSATGSLTRALTAQAGVQGDGRRLATTTGGDDAHRRGDGGHHR